MSNDFMKPVEIRIDNLVNQINTDAIISDVASRWGMTGGTVTTFYGWVTSSAGAVLIGVLVTIGGFVVNYYFQRKRHVKEMEYNELRTELLIKEDLRKEEMHQAELKVIREKSNG